MFLLKNTPAKPTESNAAFHHYSILDMALWSFLIIAIIWFFGWNPFQEVINYTNKSSVVLDYLRDNPVPLAIIVISHLALLAWIKGRRGVVIWNLPEGSKENDWFLSIGAVGKVRLNVLETIYSMFGSIFFPIFLWHMAKTELHHEWLVTVGFFIFTLITWNLRTEKSYPTCIAIVGGIFLAVMMTLNPSHVTWPLMFVAGVLYPFAQNVIRGYAWILKSYARCEEISKSGKGAGIRKLLLDLQGLYLFGNIKIFLDMSAFFSIFVVGYGLHMGFNLIAMAYIYVTWLLLYVHFALLLNGIPQKADVYVEWKTYKWARISEKNEKRVILLLKNDSRVIIPADRIIRIELGA